MSTQTDRRAAQEDFSGFAPLAGAEESQHDEAFDDDRSLGEDVRGLFDDGFAALDAELSYHKARAAYAAQSIKGIAILGILAAVIAFFSLVALTVGLVITLTPLLTALGATAAVVAGYLAVAGILAWLAASRWSKMMIALGFADPSA